jgi:superfamily I DNA/RNA helicase
VPRLSLTPNAIAVSIKPIGVVCTSQVGAKGLSAEHVFIVGMVNGDFPQDPNNVTDVEVCQLIVGLSRTRKACHLISARNWLGAWKNESVFFDWLGDIAMGRFDESDLRRFAAAEER